ncbi:hypothetical protein DUNSADRAFT_9723, partial [Dunaliella salina]
ALQIAHASELSECHGQLHQLRSLVSEMIPKLLSYDVSDKEAVYAAERLGCRIDYIKAARASTSAPLARGEREQKETVSFCLPVLHKDRDNAGEGCRNKHTDKTTHAQTNACASAQDASLPAAISAFLNAHCQTTHA